MRVLIFGCGPAGLLAAHAARQEFQAEVQIFSVKRPSPLHGCQYLHRDIPNIPTSNASVQYSLNGTEDEYRAKVYGARRLPVSPQLLTGSHPAWDIREAYQRLWTQFEGYIEHLRLRPNLIPGLIEVMNPDVVISSVPLPVLCQVGERHSFDSQKVWAIGDAPELEHAVPIETSPLTVVCDGTADTSWYRAANVFGHATIEWPGHRPKPPIAGVVEVEKPISTTCECLPEVTRVGRFGTWTKGVLADSAYAKTCFRLASS